MTDGIIDKLTKGNVAIVNNSIFYKVMRVAGSFLTHITKDFPFSLTDFSYVLLPEKTKLVSLNVGKIGNGLLVGVDDNIDSYWSSNRQELKTFCIDFDKEFYTTEKASKVVKSNVRIYLIACLFEALKFLKLPLIYIWKFPETSRSVFNLRVDIDPERHQSEEQALLSIDNTFRYAKKHSDCMTFFVNFYRRLGNFDFFKKYLLYYNFDIQSHNYFHCLFPDYRHNYKNIELAHSILQDRGCDVKGFSVPEYFWYDNTAEILEDFGYVYSNSFGLDFNNYPYRPVVKGKIREYIEIPNDPLVFSKFKKIKKENTVSFYTEYINVLMNKYLNTIGMPCLKYEHPAVLGRYPEVFKTIMAFVSENSDIKKIRLTEWAEWLKRRAYIQKLICFDYYKNCSDDYYVIKNPEGINLDAYGIGVQFDEKSVYVSRLRSDLIQHVNIRKDSRLFTHNDIGSYGKCIFTHNKKDINIFSSYKHLKKIIMNYKLFYSYKTRNYYL